MTNTLPKPLRGIFPPMITPLKDRDTLDISGLEKLIEHIIGGGASGLFILGTTGEGPSLSYRLRRELIERSACIVANRVPVLVAITDTAFVESVALARHAADSGTDAVVLAPPYYLPEGQPELQEYISHLLPELPLPLLLYNMPPLTKVPFQLETVRWALDQPGIVGMKDSGGDMRYFYDVRRLLEIRPDWTLLVGPEEMLADAALLGGHGGVCGGANVFPKLYATLYAAAAAGDLPRTRELHKLVGRVASRIYRVGVHPSAFIKGIKCAVSCLGICDDFMAEPFHRFREPERLRLKEALEECKQWLAPVLEGS